MLAEAGADANTKNTAGEAPEDLHKVFAQQKSG